MPGRIKVSPRTFDELANTLAKHGVKINEQGSLIIDKDTTFDYPYDFRLATIRQNCLNEAVKHCNSGPDVLNMAYRMYQFVLDGKLYGEDEIADEELMRGYAPPKKGWE